MSGVITRLVQLRGLLLYLFSTLWTGFRGGCLEPPDKTDGVMESILIAMQVMMIHKKKTGCTIHGGKCVRSGWLQHLWSDRRSRNKLCTVLG